MGAFDDLIPNSQSSSAGAFDDLIPKEAAPEGGFVAAAKQAIGAGIKGAGQVASDYIPGVTSANPVSAYGQSVIDANPTSVTNLGGILESPWQATKEAVGNAAGSMGSMLGARALGTGITAAAPFTGPAAPFVAGAGQLIANVGPFVAAALPSYGGIREEQIKANPLNEADARSKAIAALGAGTVGAIEGSFGPQAWALAAMKKGGIEEVAKKFADAKSITGAIGKGFVKGAAVEGAEEVAQNPIEQVTSYRDPTTKEAISETLFGGAMGALGGGVAGGGISGVAYATSGPLSKAVAAAPGAGVPPSVPAPDAGIQPQEPVPAAGIASAAQFPQFTAPPQPVTGGAPLEQEPTAMPVPQATQNAPAAPGSPSPVSAADPLLPAKQAEAAGAPIQPPQGPLPSANQTEVAIPPAQGPEAAALPAPAKPAKGIAAALQYPQQVTEGGGPLAQQAADIPLGRFGNSTKKPDTSPTIRDANSQESAVAGRARKVLDLRDNETGWKAVDYPNGDGVFLISADGKKAVEFPSKDRRSGTAAIRANASAQAFAIDNPYSSGKKPPQNDLVITPVFKKKPDISPDISPDIPAKKSTRIAASSGIAGALVTPQQPTFGGAPLEQSPVAMPLGKHGKPKASEPAAPQSTPSISDLNSGKSLVDGIRLKIAKTVAWATNDGKRRMDRAWEANAVKRLIESDIAGHLQGKQYGRRAAAKIAIYKSKTFSELDSAVGRIAEQESNQESSPPDAPQQPLSGAGAPQARRQPQPAPIMRRDDLVGAIIRATGGDGIASNMALTIAGDTAGRGLSKLRGLFTNRGTIDLGEVATRLREDEGFDVRDGEHLSELIRAASFGDTAVSMERAELDQDAVEEKRHRDYIRQNAKKLKIKSVAVKFSDLEQRVIAALTRRHERAVELLDERAKKRFDAALEESYALLPEDVVDAVLVDVNGRGLKTLEFWKEATKLLRYMVADARAQKEQEAFDAIEGAEPDWLKDDDGRGNKPAGGGEEVNRVAEEARGEAGFNLAAQTPEEIAAAEAAAKAAEAKAEKEKKDAEDAQKKAELTAEVKKRSEAAADTFELGGNATDNLTGQKDIFAAPAPAPAAKPSPDQAAIDKANADFDDALNDLGDIIGKTFRSNFTPEQEQKLIPVLTRLMDAAFRKGYYKFKEAARFVLESIGAKFGKDLADQITLDHLQGAYIGMAGRYKDQGADSAKAVVSVEDRKEVEPRDTDELPPGWVEAYAGGMATNKDKVSGGIVDTNLKTGKWFFVPENDNIGTMEGFDTRREALDALSMAVEKAAKSTTLKAKGLANVTNERSGANLERDSQDANIADGVGAKGVPVGAGGNGGAGRPGVAGSGAERSQPAGGNGLRDGEAAIAGERGNLEVHTGATKLSPGSAGNSVDLGGDSVGVGGLPIEPDAASRIKEAARGGIQLEVAKTKQRAADKAPFAKGLEAIRQSLPILTEGQQEDVFQTETRFAVPDGYGMLFTNGTGTGKTFSALGVIKRFAAQGKQNILVVAPSQEIISAWQKAGKLLGLDLSLLEDINDAGSGMVITTYANMGANNELASRDWDLIVHDEAHYLSMNKDGTNTESLNALRAISLHPDGALKLARMLHADLYDKQAELVRQEIAQRTAGNKALSDKIQSRIEALSREIRPKEDAVKEKVSANQGVKRPRVMFLSATPFAYEKSVDWANGYLFDYNEGRGDERNEFRGYNAGSNSDQFMMQHFGYRMRYGKLTAPDAKVDSGLMQRQFNSWLKKSGSLSGRMLDVDADYDRRFILVDSAIGQRIDEALQWFDAQRKATNDKDRQAVISAVQEFISEKFDYLSRRYLLESIKAKEVVPHVREHLAMGRKVVVFHDYKKGGGFNPFIIGERTAKDQDSKEAATSAAEWNGVVGAFNAEFKDIINSDLFKQTSPILMFKNEFPGVLLFNGDVSVKERRANVQRFQDDASGPQVILVQSAAGKEGISLHDTTGKHQRVLFNLGQPTQPTTAIQQEGRIYRTGQVTDAIFRYLNTGTNWEKWAFATTIANRASAAENLGMGELARSLKDAFIAGFEESDNYRAGMDGEGKGGKERDKAANNALTEYDRARAFYFGTQKKNGRTKAQEGDDYFATPEPVGLKMVEWANVRPGEKVLEPSAGHGAIARWMPTTAERTAVEPSMTLRPRLAMVFDGQIIDSDFESLNVVNKYDAIVMNPPFGSGGKTAIDHLAKAATHLRDGGRIVALLPTGPAADKKFEKWFYEESTKSLKPLTTYTIDGKATPIYKGDTIESKATWAPSGVVARVLGAVGNNEPDIMVKATAPEFRGAETRMSAAQIKMIQPTGKRETTFKAADGLNLVADIKLPQVTFERAGTAVSTRIVVIEKSANSPQQTSRDLSDVADINTLFDRLENMALPDRAKEPEPEAAAAPAKKEKAPPAQVGDSVTVNGNQYAIEIYTTNDGKDKRGIWMEEKEAKAINPRAFKSSKMRGTPAEGKFFVDEYWLNKRAPDSSSRFSFAGQQSATADQFQLDRAKQLLADGANANSVRQQTGWFQNPSDGKWRYEIDDSDASLQNMRMEDGLAMRATSLATILDHPALFAAYPALRDMDVQITIDFDGQEGGSFERGSAGDSKTFGRQPEIKVNARTEEKALSTLLHEIQHGIQNVEGFASGGNPRIISAEIDDLVERKMRLSDYAGMGNESAAQELRKVEKELQSYGYDAYAAYRKLAGEVESRNVQQRQNFPADKRRLSDPLGTQDVAPEDVIVVFNGKDAKDAPAPFNTARASAMAAVGASPADAAVFDMASEGRYAQEILAFLSKASRRPFNRVLAAALSRIGVSSTVSIDPAAGWRNSQNRQGARFAASYSPKTDTVSLFTPRNAEIHALHEFVHAASIKAIARGGPAARQMQAIFDYVQRTGTMSDQYGMGNFSRFPNETDAQFKKRMLDEFTAELFTNPQFQVRLKQLPAPSGSKLKSAWDWIVRVIANLLGLKTRAQETALDRALSVGAALLQENAALAAAQGGERFSQEQPFSGREVAATPLKPGNGFTAKQLGEIRDLSRKIEQQARFNAERAKSLPEGHKLRATGIRALAALQERYATAVAARAGFDAWFGKSKAVGPEGDPLVLYHGTTRDITAFKRKDGGRAIWAADSLTANSYAGESSGSNVLPVFMSIQNPLVVDAGGASFRDLRFENRRLDADELSDIAEERGYDGLIIRDLRDHDTDDGGDYPADHYAAFSQTQVKSATSNTGAFSPEDPDIRYSLATNWQQSPVAPGNLYQAAKKKAASLLTPERLDKVIYETQDKFIDLRRIRDHIKEIGGTITDLNDAYLGEELYHKRLAYRTEQFLKEELQPFFADMKARGVEMPEFEKFLHARHAPEANDEMAKRNPNQKQIDAGRQKSAATVRALELNLQTAKARGLATVAIEKSLNDARAELVRWNGAQAFKGTEAERLSLSGMSNADAGALMASLTPAQRSDMNALAAKVDAINEGTLQTLERYGLMDKAAMDAWRKTYKHYVPLHRDEAHPDSVSHPIGQGFNVRGDASKRRTGSNQEVTNIFGHIAMQREAALTRGEKNRVMQKLYLMARQNQIADIWSVGKVPMIDTIDKATGFVRSVPDPQYKDNPNVITLRIAGKDVAIVINEYNPQALRLAQSIKNLDVDDLHYLIPVVGKATRWFASINTQYNPIFGLINFARDVQTAALNLSTTAIAGKQKEVFKDTMSILGDIIKNKGRMPTAGKWAPIYKEFNEVGGTTGYRDLFLTAEDRSKAVTDEIKALDRGKVSQAAHAVAGWLSDYNEAMENATRLAAYKAAIDNGMSKERAASLAKNLTVNFNRKGRQTRELGALYAFFNAAVQGTARMAQTLSGPAGKKIMLGGVLAGAASAMAGIAAMGGGDGEDDEWSKIPEFIKERSFIIPAGKDKYIAIPMPLGFHFLPNIGRLMVEMAAYKDKTLGKQMASLFTVLADAFNPLGGSAPPMQIIAPTVMDPFIALAQNKDWTGKPIYVENFNSLNPQPGAARAKDSATPIANGLADAINAVTGGTKYVPGALSPTPDQIDYVIGQLTGGVGRELGKLSSTIAAPFTGDELPAHKIPLLGRLYGSTAGATGQAGKFYENIKRANEVENELKGRRKDGISVDDYLQDNPKAVELAARGNAAERQIRALRQMRSRIVEAGGDDAASKARQINERMATVMRGFNMQVERMQ